MSADLKRLRLTIEVDGWHFGECDRNSDEYGATSSQSMREFLSLEKHCTPDITADSALASGRPRGS